MQQALFDAATPAAAPLQRFWRLQGQARRRGRAIEPLRVTPRFLARIDTRQCPVTREPVTPHGAAVVALRADAAVAAGHLVTLGPTAAAAPEGGWAEAWAIAEALAPGGRSAGLDAAAWRRLAVLRSFVQPLSAAEAAGLPLLVLPTHRLRVLSPVQSLQVALTLALRQADRAARLTALVDRVHDEDLRLALRVFVLALLARAPATADRCALEDLWTDPLLQRRWQRLALRLDDAGADRLLQQARRRGLLTGPWRALDPAWAVEGWGLGAESSDEPAPTTVAAAVLAAGRRRRLAHAGAGAAAGR
jgi:hypothetical protein